MKDSFTKRIKRVQLKWVQSIQYLDLELDKDVTRISGKNASGKSAIAKGLSLFSGTYKRGEIKGLVSSNRPEGETTQVLVTLFNGDNLLAEIGNTSRVVYKLYREGKLEKVWESHNDEITDILGWRTIGEDNKISLDIKDSKKNLLVDTTPRENAEMVDDLYRNVDVELRIHNLEENLKEIREQKKIMRDKRSQYFYKKEETGLIDLISLESIRERVLKIDTMEDDNNSKKKLYKHFLLDLELKDTEDLKMFIIKIEYMEKIQKFIENKQEELEINNIARVLHESLSNKYYKRWISNNIYNKIMEDELNTIENINLPIFNIIDITKPRTLIDNIIDLDKIGLEKTELYCILKTLEKNKDIFNFLKNINLVSKRYINMLKIEEDVEKARILFINYDIENRKKMYLRANIASNKVDDNIQIFTQSGDNLVRFKEIRELNGRKGAFIERHLSSELTLSTLEEVTSIREYVSTVKQIFDNNLDVTILSEKIKDLSLLEKEIKLLDKVGLTLMTTTNDSNNFIKLFTLIDLKYKYLKKSSDGYKFSKIVEEIVKVCPSCRQIIRT